MTSEWLRTIWPQLVSARYLRVVRIDPFAGIGSAINVTGAKHDFRESREAGTHTCRFWPDDIFHRIICRPGDDSSAGIRLNRGGEKSERERGLSRRGEYLESEGIR
jgi:hypothetical protein